MSFGDKRLDESFDRWVTSAPEPLSSEEQADYFLQKTNTKIKVKFFKHDIYFDDEKDTRDIFKVTLKNDKHSYTFTFGQSVNLSDGKGTQMPSAYDILSCLTKYHVGSFYDFCDDFGYDSDSIKANNTYKKVLKEWENVSKLWNEQEIEELQEIE